MPRPMTELEENTLRTLLSRMREEKPLEFVDIVLQTVFRRFEDDSIAAINHKNNEGEVDGVFMIFKGKQVAEWASVCLADLQKKLKERDGD